MGDLDENKIIKKIQKFEILKAKATKQRTHFFNHLAKQLC
jgi:hypothetical protein